MDKITNLLVPILLIEMILSTGLGISWSGQAMSTDGSISPSLTTSLRTERKQIHLPTRITLHTYILFSGDFAGGLQAPIRDPSC
jgi:hypothetical protein